MDQQHSNYSKTRVCIDLRDLNRAIRRPKYQMPTVEEILPTGKGQTMYSITPSSYGHIEPTFNPG